MGERGSSVNPEMIGGQQLAIQYTLSRQLSAWSNAENQRQSCMSNAALSPTLENPNTVHESIPVHVSESNPVEVSKPPAQGSCQQPREAESQSSDSAGA